MSSLPHDFKAMMNRDQQQSDRSNNNRERSSEDPQQDHGYGQHGHHHHHHHHHHADSFSHSTGMETPPFRRSILSTEHFAGLDGTSIMDPPSSTQSASMRGAAKELLGLAARRSRRSIVDVRNPSSFLSAAQEATSSFMEDSAYHEDDSVSAAANIASIFEKPESIYEHDEDEHNESNVSLLSESHNHGSVYGAIAATNATSATHMNGNGISGPDASKMPFNGDVEAKHHGAKGSATTANASATPHNDTLHVIIQQSSAVAVVALLNMMIAIPFGASYFPVGWKSIDGSDHTSSSNAEEEESDDVDGTFPLPGKVALGIRMFLFATAVGQLIGTFSSKFTNPIYLQMVENVPFLHALAYIVIEEQGYGIEALSTLFFLFGLSSVIVGITFYTLGKLELGRIVYFFPSHVLVGCIGGIGAFIIITAIEVTNNASFTFDMNGIEAFIDNFHLFVVVIFFEATLRILIIVTQDKHGRPRFPLLTPVFYCMITPLFYIGMAILGVNMD
eukprot:CAMPEP_0119573812 /NCGR_PEP_ID=MMETSP1352-20130426/45312_1 /TAXON_ID=265584 /ORGANISM="Stauroneis constricta, Strain CCMP1120" /LENGTH=503 /DNA_ID=CAMNT_0007623503 /DNA_START=302 /DNA_END=1810 /DNA_ORIENTATION=-